MASICGIVTALQLLGSAFALEAPRARARAPLPSMSRQHRQAEASMLATGEVLSEGLDQETSLMRREEVRARIGTDPITTVPPNCYPPFVGSILAPTGPFIKALPANSSGPNATTAQECINSCAVQATAAYTCVMYVFQLIGGPDTGNASCTMFASATHLQVNTRPVPYAQSGYCNFYLDPGNGGVRGAKGWIGPPGISSYRGIKGKMGAAGPKGAQGVTGPPGVPGVVGDPAGPPPAPDMSAYIPTKFLILGVLFSEALVAGFIVRGHNVFLDHGKGGHGQTKEAEAPAPAADGAAPPADGAVQG